MLAEREEDLSGSSFLRERSQSETWIESAQRNLRGSPTTFAGYARALRFIASEIVAMNKTSKRFEKAQSGEYRRKVDAYPLSILTPQAMQSGASPTSPGRAADPAKARAARITANFTMRNCEESFQQADREIHRT